MSEILINGSAEKVVTLEVPRIKIIVGGDAAVGKSVIAEFIRLCLENVGIEATVDEPDHTPEHMAESFQARLKAVCLSMPSVEIEMLPMRKMPGESQLIMPPGIRHA